VISTWIWCFCFVIPSLLILDARYFLDLWFRFSRSCQRSLFNLLWNLISLWKWERIFFKLSSVSGPDLCAYDSLARLGIEPRTCEAPFLASYLIKLLASLRSHWSIDDQFFSAIDWFFMFIVKLHCCCKFWSFKKIKARFHVPPHLLIPQLITLFFVGQNFWHYCALIMMFKGKGSQRPLSSC